MKVERAKKLNSKLRTSARGQTGTNIHRLTSAAFNCPVFMVLWVLCLIPLSGCNPSIRSTSTPIPPTTNDVSLETPPPAITPIVSRAEPTLYIPPTAAPGLTPPTANPVLSPSPTTILQPFLATVTPACVNDLLFLEDLTIPDGSIVAPGELLDKRWQVENSGTCNWDAGYTLRLMDGPNLGVPLIQSLYPARSGAKATIRMLFTAPSNPGRIQSAWKAFDPQGQEFGEAIFIQIIVRTAATP